MASKPLVLFLFLMVLGWKGLASEPVHQDTPNTAPEAHHYFLGILSDYEPSVFRKHLKAIDEDWQPAFEIMAIETLYYMQTHRRGRPLLALLEKHTGQRFGFDFDKWWQWLWNKPSNYDPSYFEFKAELHRRIDPRFQRYFSKRSAQSSIRLDEVRWGGVLQDGIPPLRNPTMIRPDEATYLRDGALVFGIEINGEARAYPKQILAWHELFTDTVGGIKVAGVYCTLCGTVILYETEHDGIEHELGTSGFLYRSNKLMYDQATQSLWSTLEGKPVIGPLTGTGIELEFRSVVTTTWGEWKKRHPNTTVLSLRTGHQRDYREGVAYKDYFADDDLMFTVPEIDSRLNNKDEVLVVRNPDDLSDQLVFSNRFLRQNPIHRDRLEMGVFTIFTDSTGAHRVYRTDATEFDTYDGGEKVKDLDGFWWTLEENGMRNESGEILERIHTFNAFWFGYKAAFPEVRLVR
ncbi:DUF3179 domain-containing (seleno)protein [Flagellimonas sp. DF-77]|uniref:DUF3179 domain-containing (seleno)protein n=1 Tax=Flagellimonas algarum TaxID=3230298 RepID=UPI00339886FA